MAEDASDTGWPKIVARRRNRISPWVTLIEREVRFTPATAGELYHAIEQGDYIAIVAVTPDGLIPIVRQYRPAAESFTWELPAGMVDAGEDALATCRRELLEETGLTAATVAAVGNHAPCTARLSNRIHTFFVETEQAPAVLDAEPGLEVRLVTPAELGGLIRSGEFTLQLHIGALMLAGLKGHIDFESFCK
jgi:8-oxo-dGTP pyrophosphatase MutT (NUDIX family)